jgi:hypothetical protein
MARLTDAAQEIVSFLRAQGWSCCIVGGMAVPRWGEPRATADVDICLFTGLGDEKSFVEPLLAHFSPRLAGAGEFAEQSRVLLITASNGIGIDVALAWTPFEANMIARATPHRFTRKITLPTASAEDVVIMKAFADRPQDWVDVKGVLVKQHGKLDWDYIRRELSVLCELKEAPDIMDQLEQMRKNVDAE